MDPLRETNWYAIHAKSHREPAAAMNIERLGLEVFLPLVKRERVVFEAVRKVVDPLFPGYLFARFCPATYLHLIRYARGVHRVVGSGRAPLPVDETIIQTIRGRIGKDGYVTLARKRLRHGERVTIQAGPLQGMTGIFDRELKDQDRVAILLASISYQASVLVGRNDLRPADATA
jgi:transcriptional antiterminator RfaH